MIVRESIVMLSLLQILVYQLLLYSRTQEFIISCNRFRENQQKKNPCHSFSITHRIWLSLCQRSALTNNDRRYRDRVMTLNEEGCRLNRDQRNGEFSDFENPSLKNVSSEYRSVFAADKNDSSKIYGSCIGGSLVRLTYFFTFLAQISVFYLFGTESGQRNI